MAWSKGLHPVSTQGTSDDVPIYLRYEGQLKNHRLKKNAVVRILKEVWKEKVMEDGRVN